MKEQQEKLTQQSEEWAQQAELLLQAVYSCRYSIIELVKALVMKITLPVLQRGIAFLYSHPGLRIRFDSLIRKLDLYEPLRTIYLRFINQSQRILSISRRMPVVFIPTLELPLFFAKMKATDAYCY